MRGQISAAASKQGRKRVDWRAKIAVAIVVVGVGLAAALQFRKHGGGASDASPATSSDTAASSQPARTPAAQNTVPYRSTSLDHLGETAPSPTAPATDVASAATPRAETTDSAMSPSAKNGLVDLNAPPQTHKVVDGDTLPKLSQQYFGRTDRYMEIFDFNRDVLQSPDVLPIGAELRIPSGLALPASQNGTAKDVAASATATSSAAAAPLVPLITPASNPASPHHKPFTYTVKKGDNLVDLARKFYGDGRRHTDLYEANRGVMHNPGDLRPGMVLIVP